MNSQSDLVIKEVDVLILGGGISGCTAGIALLKREDVRVSIVERGDYSEHKYGESLSSSVRSTLEYLGVWDEFCATQSQEAFYSQVSWGSAESRRLGHMFAENGTGWALNRLRFEKMLADTFVSRGGELLARNQVVTCEARPQGGWRVLVKDEQGSTYVTHCKFIIDASGRRGVMRTNLNLALTVHDRLVGVGCIARLPEGTSATVENHVEAAEYGWWHVTPMVDGRVSVVLMSDPDILNKLHGSQPAVWRALFAKTQIGSSLQSLDFEDVPRAFPCYSSYLKNAGGKDWVAVGDAVASYDPISSSGIPRALATGVHGAFIAVDHLFSEGSLLDTYAQAIEQDFRQYLQTQWQYYQRETRWPESVFWARRRAVIAISKDSMIQEVHFYESKITVQPLHLKSNEMHDLWSLCQRGKVLRQVMMEFSEKHAHIPEQKILLGFQELIERNYLEIAVEEEEDCVFFNTERLYFD